MAAASIHSASRRGRRGAAANFFFVNTGNFWRRRGEWGIIAVPAARADGAFYPKTPPQGAKENPRIERQAELRINRQITAPEVRLIGPDGAQVGVLSLEDALRRAEDNGLDLVEMAPNAKPVVCKILDYGKHKYQESKRRNDARERRRPTRVKEVKFRLSISDSDYGVKLRNAVRFLEEGSRVKAAVWFRGREIVRQNLGMALLERLRADLADLADFDRAPAMEGRRLQVLLVPKRREKERKRDAKDEDQQERRQAL